MLQRKKKTMLKNVLIPIYREEQSKYMTGYDVIRLKSKFIKDFESYMQRTGLRISCIYIKIISIFSNTLNSVLTAIKEEESELDLM